MFEMKLATCATLMGVLPESTGSLKTSYFSRESISRAARPKEARGVYLPLNVKLTLMKNVVPDSVKNVPLCAIDVDLKK